MTEEALTAQHSRIDDARELHVELSDDVLLTLHHWHLLYR